MKKIVKGNDFTMRIPVVKIVDGEKQAFPLPGCTDIVVRACSAYRRLELAYTVDAKEDNVLLARVEGDEIPLGTYALEVRGKIFGNDWRSNEYPQFQIVNENADADTEFAEADDGDNSVEMDTAIVFLPPDRELSALVNQAQENMKTVDALNAQVTGSEEARTKSEESRAAAETARVQAELTRVSQETARVQAELTRVSQETARVQVEQARVTSEEGRARSEESRAESEVARVDAEKKRATAEDTRVRTELEREANELTRKANETARQTAETKRESDTTTAISSMQDKTTAAVKTMQDATNTAIASMDEHKMAFDDAEATRVGNEKTRESQETARQTAEEEREATLAKTKASCEQAAKDAADAASEATLAKTKADAAATEAEKVNAVLNGNVLTVTDRHGTEKNVNLTDSDEHVTVNISTDKADVSVEGVKISVYVNNGENYTQYATDAQGQTTFTAQKGSTYRIVFPYIAGCDPIDPVQHVAAVGNRIVDAHYKNETDRKEHVRVTVKKAEGVDDTPVAWEGVNVYLTIGKEVTSYVTDKNGTAEFDVKDGAAYTVSVDEVEGMFEQNDLYKISRTAFSSEYRVNFVFRNYESGVFLIDDDNKQWTFSEWEASGNDNARLAFVAIKTKDTQRYKGDIYVSIDMIANWDKNPNKNWASTDWYLYTSVPENGNVTSDTRYYTFAYNGLYATQCIIKEAAEKGRTDIAFATYCYGETIEQGGKTWQGYGPTIQQWQLFWQNVNMVLEAVHKKYPDSNVGQSDLSVKKWSITQYSLVDAWYFASSAGTNRKSFSFMAVPFFACLSASPSLSLSNGEQG